MPANIVCLETWKGDKIAALEQERAAFSVTVTPDNLIAVFAEELLTPTQALELAELIRARALEAFR